MKEKQTNSGEKVVLFPGVVDKLVSKGMDALKEKGFTDAFSYFEQALEIESDHPQARFGIALSLIEQSRLQEAKQVTESMLKEDIGNYYDILQVHISLLVQLGNYEEVVAMLEGIIGEEKLPANLAESLYHLLHFSRQMVNDRNGVDTDDEGCHPPEELINLLYNGKVEEQWVTIQMLSKLCIENTIDVFKHFLAQKKHDPVLKSFVLQVLKEKNIDETITVHKFGEKITVNVKQLEDVFHEKLGQNVLKLVASHLENENPSLYEFVKQIWWHYLFAIYPLSPSPMNIQLWAAALYYVGSEITGIEVDDIELANEFHVNLSELKEAAEKIIEIEQSSFKGVN